MRIYKLFTLMIGLIVCPQGFALNIHTQKYDIAYQQGLKIHLKEKKLSQTKNNKIILLINPLSIPSLTAFDVSGYSLMDTLAKSGFDVWGIDFIGQGKSSFPPEMQKNPAPIGLLPLQARDAVHQLNTAVHFIQNKTGAKTVSLLGWSWGSVVAAMYSIENPKIVDHLILYGAMYSFLMPASSQMLFVQPYRATDQSFSKALPAYQNIPWKIIESHWKRMLNGNKTITTQDAFDAVGHTYKGADPNPIVKGTLRRPMGPIKDLFSIWNNQSVYNINRLVTPTLIIYGDQDLFAEKDLYSKLTHVKKKKEVVLKEATHWLIYEKARTQFNDEIIQFLNK